MRAIFLDKSGTLRSGWRAIFFLSSFIFAMSFLGYLAYFILENLNSSPERASNIGLVLNALFSLMVALLLSWLCAKHLEGLPFRSLGTAFTERWYQHLAIGMILGAATLGISVLAGLLGGGLSFTFNSSSTPGAIVYSLTLSLLVFSAAAAFEEILFRGYVLQTLARSGFAWLAIILTSAFFGIVHMGNPNASVVSSINTILAGVWFGLAYLKTRDLWFVWGLHLMWNWTQGAIFGIEVSGITSVTSSPILREIDHGPIWLTGNEYGIEGSIACTLAIIFSSLLIYKLPGIKPAPELLKMTTYVDQRVPKRSVS
jgi:membrane protease YdiL (CAAX protease family)